MTENKVKTVVLVGHCGPDSSFLRMAVSSAVPGARVSMADSDEELAEAVEAGIDLVMLNRVLDYGFDDRDGVSLLRQLKQRHPGQRVMMISNYPDTHVAAEAAGGLPGFGKREIGSPKVKDRIASALAD